jgi:hypothetical protein
MRPHPTLLLLAALAALSTVPVAVASPATPAVGMVGCLTSSPAPHRIVSPSRMIEPVDADGAGGALALASPTPRAGRVGAPSMAPETHVQPPVPPVDRLHLRERAGNPATAPPFPA